MNGPTFPIEFSRVSRDGRLTLVIDLKHGELVSARYAESSREDLGDAIADLRDREGTIRKRIGFVDTFNDRNSGSEFRDHADVFTIVADWCTERQLDAAIWTALHPQFQEETDMKFTVENAVEYLKGLPSSARKQALEYIRKAPGEVDTPFRRKVTELGMVGK